MSLKSTLARAGQRQDDKPGGFQADVGKISDLLMSEAVYDSHDISIRELIQNALDANSRRVKDLRASSAPPEIIVSIDPGGDFFDIIDFGDGMDCHALRTKFSMLGESMNERFHKVTSEGQTVEVPLTGKFGIGFISVFMIAKKVIVSTKSPLDDAHHLYIHNVRDPFYYTDASLCERDSRDQGTTIRVLLKDEFTTRGATPLNVGQLVYHYCRHVPGLHIVSSKLKTKVESNWNHSTDAPVVVSGSNTKRSWSGSLAWAGGNFDSIKISNGGFFVQDLNIDALGDFPRGLITGEINFAPGAIDLVVSRNSVVHNEKSQEIVSVLSGLFKRLVLESEKLLDRDNALIERKLGLAAILRPALTILVGLIKNGTVGKIPIGFTDDIVRTYVKSFVCSVVADAKRGGRRPHADLEKRIRNGEIDVVLYDSPIDGVTEADIRWVQGRTVVIARAENYFAQMNTEKKSFNEGELMMSALKTSGIAIISTAEAKTRHLSPNFFVKLTRSFGRRLDT
jgi:hypothetical protein